MHKLFSIPAAIAIFNLNNKKEKKIIKIDFLSRVYRMRSSRGR